MDDMGVEPLANAPHGHRGRAVVSWATVVLGAFTLLASGALAATLWLTPAVPTVIASPSRGSNVTVTQQTYDGAHDVMARLQLEPTLTLKIPMTGVLGATACKPADLIASGSSPLRIDGQPILALATRIPLWRDLTIGTRGADVAALQAELTRLGHPVHATGIYDSATVSATTAALKAIGAAFPDGSLPLAVVMWLPKAEITVASCATQVGDQVTAGMQFAQVAGALLSMTLVNPSGVSGWAASYGGVTVRVGADGIISDRTLLAAVETGPDFAVATAPGGTNTITVRVALFSAIDVLVVPPSSVVLSGPDTGCVVSDARTIPVVIVTSSLGRTLVKVVSGAVPDHVDVRPDKTVRCS